MALILAAALAESAGAAPLLGPGKPANVRSAQNNRDVLTGVGLVGTAGLVIAGILIFAPSDVKAPAPTTGTNP